MSGLDNDGIGYHLIFYHIPPPVPALVFIVVDHSRICQSLLLLAGQTIQSWELVIIVRCHQWQRCWQCRIHCHHRNLVGQSMEPPHHPWKLVLVLELLCVPSHLDQANWAAAGSCCCGFVELPLKE